MADTAQATEYVVLSKPIQQANITASGLQGWEVVRTVTARSASEAIRAVAEPKGEAFYAAVPGRSWNPVKVTPKVTTTFEIEGGRADGAACPSSGGTGTPLAIPGQLDVFEVLAAA